MKKLLLILLVAFGLQTQAQMPYCDSLNLNGEIIEDSLGFYHLSGTFDGQLQCDSLNQTSYWWTVMTGLNPTSPFDLYQINNPVVQLNTIDTLKVCFTVDLLGIVDCTWCDTLIFNGFNWVSLNTNPLAINEINTNTITDNKIYDILGREINNFNSIPFGTIYIQNRQKYIKLK